jgi:hypothetical protein
MLHCKRGAQPIQKGATPPLRHVGSVSTTHARPRPPRLQPFPHVQTRRPGAIARGHRRPARSLSSRCKHCTEWTASLVNRRTMRCQRRRRHAVLLPRTTLRRLCGALRGVKDSQQKPVVQEFSRRQQLRRSRRRGEEAASCAVELVVMRSGRAREALRQ